MRVLPGRCSSECLLWRYLVQTVSLDYVGEAFADRKPNFFYFI